MQKKQLIQIGVPALLLIAAIVVLLLLQNDSSNTESETAEDTIYALGGIPQRTVQTIAVENRQDSYILSQNQTASESDVEDEAIAEPEITTSIDGLETGTLNQTLLKSVTTNLGSLPASRVIGGSDADLSAYGLDEPLATVTVTYADGVETLLLGDEAPGNGGTYAKVGDTVYLVDTNKIQHLFSGRLDFVNKNITPGNSQTTELDSVILSGEVLAEPIHIEQIPDGEAGNQTSESGYRLTTPVAHNASSESIYTALQTLYGLTALEVVSLASDAEWDPYKRFAPYLQVEMTTVQPEPAEGETETEDGIPPFTLFFSEPDADGNTYVRCDLSPYLYQIPSASVPVMGMTVFDYMAKSVATPRIDALREIEVATGDTAATFSLTGEGDNLAVTCNGESIGTENFRRFFQTLTAARYDAETIDTDLTAADSDSSELLRYTYRYRDGSEQVVSFQPGPVRRALVSLDGGRAYTTPSTYVDRVLADLERILTGETVSAYQ